MANRNAYLVPTLVAINTLWLLYYSSTSSPNLFVILSQTSRSLDADIARDAPCNLRRPAITEEAPQFLLKFPGLPVCEPLESSEDVDVTLVTQTSLDRLHLMEDICERWTGPISLVVANVWLEQTDLMDQLASLGCFPPRITASVYNTDFPRGKYPVNTLRNIALRQAKTSHAINVDIDLLPSTELYQDILHHRETLRKDDHDAIVVPAFQLNPTPECEAAESMVTEECSEILRGMLPETKDELLKLYGHPFDEPEPRINQFTGRDHYYGHSSTGYDAWAKQQPRHSLEPLECLHSVRYEPYLVVRLCQDLPPYQEQFTGYGKNKVSWMWQVQRSGYRLLRLGSGFAIHYPHPRSTAKKTWTKNKKAVGRENVDVERYATAFRAFLQAEVPDEAATPFCDHYEQSYS